MKFSVMSALIGVSTQMSVKSLNNSFQAKCDKMSAMCNVDALSQMATSNLVQIGDDTTTTHVNHGIANYNDNTKEGVAAHYGKTKAEIDAENKKILDTQKQCLDFVNDHPDHPEVCKWCQENHQPTDPWQWNPTEGVWYKYSNGEYKYWGPSKEGLKHDWSWYDGYWHHNGYVYKYENNKWHRFQGNKWVEYGDKIDINPKPPHEIECRNVLRLERYHVPDSLTEQDLPRCQVGTGTQKEIFKWTNDQDCIFLGGTKIFQKNYECSDGSKEQFRQVEVCVQGNKISGEGLDYKTGEAKVVEASFNFQPTPMETTKSQVDIFHIQGSGIFRDDDTHEPLDLGVFGKTYFDPKLIEIDCDWKDQGSGESKAQLFLRLYRGDQLIKDVDIFGIYQRGKEGVNQKTRKFTSADPIVSLAKAGDTFKVYGRVGAGGDHELHVTKLHIDFSSSEETSKV